MTDKHILWTASEAAQATQGVCASDWRASGLSFDSRTVQPGDLFIAMDNEKGDSYPFVADALANGSSRSALSRRWLTATLLGWTMA